MSIVKEIEKVRTHIADLKKEREELKAFRLSRAEAQTAISDYLRHVAEKRVDEFRHELLLFARDGHGRPLQETAVGHFGEGETHVHAIVDMLPVMAALLGVAQIEALVEANIGVVPEGLDKQARAKRLREIEVELLAAERKEEALIVKAEAQELVVYRRADARPEIVLEMLD